MTESRIHLTQFLIAYVVALVAIGLCDGLWLGWLAKDLYRREMGNLMTDSVRILPAALFYLAYPAGLIYLALGGGAGVGVTGLGEAVLRSAVLGLVAYGTYDMTALAVIRGFSGSLAVIDLAYGTVVSGIAGGAAWFIALRG